MNKSKGKTMEFKLTKKDKKSIMVTLILIVLVIFSYFIGWISKPQIDCKPQAEMMADYIEEQLNNSEQFYKSIPYYNLIVDNVETIKYYYFIYKSVSRLVLENHLNAALINITESK